jgi:hypothetical protein
VRGRVALDPAHERALDPHVPDLVHRGGEEIAVEHREVGQLSGREVALAAFLAARVGAEDGVGARGLGAGTDPRAAVGVVADRDEAAVAGGQGRHDPAIAVEGREAAAERDQVGDQPAHASLLPRRPA